MGAGIAQVAAQNGVKASLMQCKRPKPVAKEGGG